MTTSKEVKREKRIAEMEEKRQERKELKNWNKTIAYLKTRGAVIEGTEHIKNI